MITEAVLTLVVNFVEWFVALVPTFGLDLSGLDMSGLWADVGSRAAVLNGWVPVQTGAGALAVFMTVQVAMSVFGLVVWIYHQFWGSD